MQEVVGSKLEVIAVAQEAVAEQNGRLRELQPAIDEIDQLIAKDKDEVQAYKVSHGRPEPDCQADPRRGP